MAFGREFVGETLGAFLLVLMVFALTEGCNVGRPDNALAPVVIGLTVTSIICLVAPLTQAGLNPARDFGPRLFAWLAGWKAVAIPGPRGGFFTVYILSPIIGALAGGWAYERLVRRTLILVRSTQSAKAIQEEEARKRVA